LYASLPPANSYNMYMHYMYIVSWYNVFVEHIEHVEFVFIVTCTYIYNRLDMKVVTQLPDKNRSL